MTSPFRHPAVPIGLLVIALLGACSQAVTPPTPTPGPTPRATAVPTATLPPPTATPIPTTSASPSAAVSPSPNSAVGDAIIDRFLTNFADAKPPFDLDTVVMADISGSGETFSLEVRIEAEISGEDLAGTMTLVSEDQASITEVVIKDGRAYRRQPGGLWTLAEDFNQTQPLNPFGLLATEDLTYVGTTDRDGSTLHRLRTTKWIGEDPASNPALQDARIEGSQFDVFVDENGIPLEAELAFQMTAVVNQQAAVFDYVTTYLFSDVGAPNQIEAPAS